MFHLFVWPKKHRILYFHLTVSAFYAPTVGTSPTYLCTVANITWSIKLFICHILFWWDRCWFVAAMHSVHLQTTRENHADTGPEYISSEQQWGRLFAILALFPQHYSDFTNLIFLLFILSFCPWWIVPDQQLYSVHPTVCKDLMQYANVSFPQLAGLGWCSPRFSVLRFSSWLVRDV